MGCRLHEFRADRACGAAEIACNWGRKLMEAAIDHFASSNVAGIRLVQTAYNNRSLCLYTRLGFQTREPLSVIQGLALNNKFAGYDVRPAGEADVAACNLLCRRVHGFDRGAELRRSDQRADYNRCRAPGPHHRVCDRPRFLCPCRRRDKPRLEIADCRSAGDSRTGISAPTRNHEFFAWCLDSGLKLVMQMTLMSIGLYNKPAGAWLPSILF
jgi:hypothetical protein